MRSDLALVIADLEAGGAQRVAAFLANGLSEQGLRVSVITLAGPHSDHFALAPSIERVSLSLRRRSGSAGAAVLANLARTIALRRAIRATGARTVLSFVGTVNVLTVLACQGLGLCVVISERNDPARQSLGRAWDRLRRWAYPRASLVTANSRSAVSSLQAYVPERRLAFVPNPAPVAPDPRPGQERTRRLLTVARFARQKAHDVLLAAFARVAGEFPDWRLVLLGEGSEKAAMRALADQLGIAAQVEWPEPTLDVWGHYRSASIFVLPSRHEGTPNALLEALACGLPSIVTDTSGGALEHLRDGYNGLIVPTDDPLSLAAAMRRLMAEPALRARLGTAAHEGLAPAPAVLQRWREVLLLAP